MGSQVFPPKVAVFISGRGSNLKSLLENQLHYRIWAVISDNPDAPGLSFAATMGVGTYAFDRSQFPNRAAFKSAIYEKLAELKPDLVALAGFMQIVPESVVREWMGRLVNIHPSLLPAYPGLDTHRRVLEAGERIHGCSVHFVDAGVDTGPIIAQAACEVLSSDDEQLLAARVLRYEHQIYPWVLNNLAAGKIELRGSAPYYDRLVMEEAARLRFSLPALHCLRM